MAAITLPPWWGRGDEGRSVKEEEEEAEVVKGKHSQQKVGGENCGAQEGGI